MDRKRKMNKVTKKVLIVSYHFPPDAAVGSIRPAKFAKYLGEYNWEPVILTVKKRYYERLDPTRLEEVKQIVVSRTIKIPTIKDIYLSMKNIYFRKIKSGSLYIEKQKWFPQESRLNPDEEGIVSRMHRYLNSLFVWLPDDKVGWVVPAFFRGLYLIKKHKINSIFTTSPPPSVHLVGLLLKVVTKKYWIADFRDPWFVEQKSFLIRSKLADIIEGWLNRKVIEKSDRIVSVTEEMTEMFKNQGENNLGNKAFNIWNGYDPEELERHSHTQKYNKFTITYAGTFYLDRNPELLLQALGDLIREGRIDRKNVQVRFFGNCRYINGESVEELVVNLNLRDIVVISDPIPHTEILEEIAKAHVLLLLAPDQPLQIPGKVFEYIGLKGSIIAICGEGATNNFLKRYPKAIIVSPDNLDEMKKAILTLMMRSNNNDKESVDNFPYHNYERKHLTKQLAILLEASANEALL